MFYLYITVVSLYTNKSNTRLIQASCRYQSIQKCTELCLTDVTGFKPEMWGRQTERQNLNRSGWLASMFTIRLYSYRPKYFSGFGKSKGKAIPLEFYFTSIKCNEHEL